jgi:hydroxymethylglutaryl-CoA reductase
MRIAFSYAPGKIILAGEHAVVYGHSAIALAIDRGVRIKVQETAMPHCKGHGPTLKATGLGFSGSVRPGLDGEGPLVLRQALDKLVELLGERVRDLELVVESAIPAGRGLGSSAALSVAMIRGIKQYFGELLSKTEEGRLAFELERLFHGSPSGIDHTVISHGGLIAFRRDKPHPQVESITLPRPLSFAIGIAGPHGGTVKVVEALSQRAKRHPGCFEHIFSGISQLVSEMKSSLEKGEFAAVGELMNVNQGYLNALSVSTPELERMCAIAREGALGAKLTGAGGGGAVIALVEEDASGIAKAFSDAGFLSISAKCDTQD